MRGPLISHRPPDYACPFCGIVSGENIDQQEEIVYRDEKIMCFPSKGWWPRNPGHVLIVPVDHYENIYELPLDISDRIHQLAKAVAIAFKRVHNCDGVSTRQHNEPAGNQDVWHFHLHVSPRHEGDQLYGAKRVEAAKADRLHHAELLKSYFHENPPEL